MLVSNQEDSMRNTQGNIWPNIQVPFGKVKVTFKTNHRKLIQSEANEWEEIHTYKK